MLLSDTGTFYWRTCFWEISSLIPVCTSPTRLELYGIPRPKIQILKSRHVDRETTTEPGPNQPRAQGLLGVAPRPCFDTKSLSLAWSHSLAFTSFENEATLFLPSWGPS